MKKIYLLMAVCLMCAMSMLTFAQEKKLTVYDGTATSNMVPIALSYCDSWTESQHIIPASLLTEMVGGKILGMQYYTSRTSRFTSKASIEFVMWEVPASTTTLTHFLNYGQPNAVHSGQIEFVPEDGDIRANIFFDTPFEYNGGSIVIDAQNPNSSWSDNVTYYGQNVNGASYAGYNPDIAYVNGSQQNFAPKMTFYYEKEDEPEREVITSVELQGYDVSFIKAGDNTEDVIDQIWMGLSIAEYNAPYELGGISMEKLDKTTGSYEYYEESTITGGTYRVSLCIFISDDMIDLYRFPDFFEDEGVPTATMDGNSWDNEENYGLVYPNGNSSFYVYGPGFLVSGQGMGNVQSDKVQSTKLIRDGQLLIECNGKTFNAQGAEMK